MGMFTQFTIITNPRPLNNNRPYEQPRVKPMRLLLRQRGTELWLPVDRPWPGNYGQLSAAESASPMAGTLLISSPYALKSCLVSSGTSGSGEHINA